jgi:hypothetical protein
MFLAKQSFSLLTLNRMIYFKNLVIYRGPRGLMDKASDFGSEDCRFESCRGRDFIYN